MGVKASIELDLAALGAITKQLEPAAEATMEALRGEVVAAAVMPFDQGNLQNNETFVVTASDGGAAQATLVTGSSYARYIYYHPEYNFQTANNANAGAYWLEPWVSGDQQDFVPDTFAKELKKRLE